MEKTELAVGDSTRLEIIFFTRRYDRIVTKRPRIETNEGISRYVQIIADVVVTPDSLTPLVIAPYKLDISQFGDTVRQSMTFRITNVSDRTVALSLVDIPDGLFEIGLPDSIEAGGFAYCDLNLTDSALDQEFSKSFTIECSDSARSRFTVPVLRNMRSDSLSPGRQDMDTCQTLTDQGILPTTFFTRKSLTNQLAFTTLNARENVREQTPGFRICLDRQF